MGKRHVRIGHKAPVSNLLSKRRADIVDSHKAFRKKKKSSKKQKQIAKKGRTPKTNDKKLYGFIVTNQITNIVLFLVVRSTSMGYFFSTEQFVTVFFFLISVKHKIVFALQCISMAIFIVAVTASSEYL